MEVESDDDLDMDASLPGDDESSSGESLTRSIPVRILGAVTLIIWLQIAFAVLFSIPGPPSISLTAALFGVMTLTSFFLACGNIRFRWRLLLAIGLGTLLTLVLPYNRLAGFVVVMGMGLASIGLTLFNRFLVSLVFGEKSLKWRFTLFGLMAFTTIVALVAFAVKSLMPHVVPLDVLIGLLVLVFLAWVLAFQCVPLWSRNYAEALCLVGSAMMLALTAPAIAHECLSAALQNPPTFLQVQLPTWSAIGLIWLLLYPLWLGFYALDWSLVHPNWKQHPSPIPPTSTAATTEEADVLMDN